MEKSQYDIVSGKNIENKFTLKHECNGESTFKVSLEMNTPIENRSVAIDNYESKLEDDELKVNYI